MNYNEEAVDLTRKLVSVRQNIAGGYDVDASAVDLILAFGRRCAEDMRGQCVQAAGDLSDEWLGKYKSVSARQYGEPHTLGMSDGAELVRLAISQLEVK